MTHVTQPLLPPLAEYIPYLERIWENRWLTNCGPFHEELESALVAYLDVPQVSLVSNGTIALWLALQALRVEGEVITTPFSFVATAHALRLVGATPVFVDIDPETCNLDPAKVDAAITERTTAILPVHCYGFPCDVAALQAIAEAHDVRLVYDAAHAFAVRDHGRSILAHGDLSVLSFHATKVFNTFEGGAIVAPDKATKDRIDQLRNFGFVGETIVATPSINGKMNELQAAFGLLQLRHIDRAIARRARIGAQYRAALAGVPGIGLFASGASWAPNHAYFPIRVAASYPGGRDGVWQRLQDAGILARRYFHPLIADMPGYRHLPSARAPLPVARRMAAEILCLPLHPDLPDAAIEQTIGIVLGD
ncbi:DegT/DnrJ/EryC1/StrS family aminotransferase [Hephaestia sp. MAHUQ-44]|nr:DegT/DnrJ/EryC1/StrS family aminotransferase [Hephaestia sp. MAHUQ-44]